MAIFTVAAFSLALVFDRLPSWWLWEWKPPTKDVPWGHGVGQDVSEICGGAYGEVSKADDYDLPEVVAVSWGQSDGPYALPPERLVICADGRAFLYTKGLANISQPRHLATAEVQGLFKTLLEAWPRGELHRGHEDGNFLWVLDADYNVIVAPSVQERAPGAGLRDVKHGDLNPGVDFAGRNGPYGLFRGVARMGGEFNLAGDRSGDEWVMHTKSGYSGSRVPVFKASQYYAAMKDAEQSDAVIGQNFPACVMKDLFLARKPLGHVFCYLSRHLQVAARPGDTRRCDITNKSIQVPGRGGLPNLDACEARETAVQAQMCGADFARPDTAPQVHLAYWIAPGQANACDRTPQHFDADFRELGLQLDNATADVQTLRRAARYLRKHVCFTDKYFLMRLRCNVHGCFGEGFLERLKALEDALERGASVSERSDVWHRASKQWVQCLGAAWL